MSGIEILVFSCSTAVIFLIFSFEFFLAAQIVHHCPADFQVYPRWILFPHHIRSRCHHPGYYLRPLSQLGRYYEGTAVAIIAVDKMIDIHCSFFMDKPPDLIWLLSMNILYFFH